MRAANNYCVLGPHPGNGNFSIIKYFTFIRSHLPEYLTGTFAGVCPGRRLPSADECYWLDSRAKAWWENYFLWPLQLVQLRSELFHIADQGLFWYARFLRSGKRIGTVHDLIAYLITAGKLNLNRATTRADFLTHENVRQLLGLDHIVSVSEFTAGRLVEELKIPASRITVIQNHVDSRFQPPDDSRRSVNRAKWFGDTEYAILHVGRPSVYKNRIGAIKAFGLVLKRLPHARLFLVNGAYTSDELLCISEQRLERSVRLLPSVTIGDLNDIYGAADVLVFPSYYEGFGWPPLEAMASGCPVVSSVRASLREVVGDAALTVENPDDHPAIAERLIDVLTAAQTARDLRRRGLDRARQFRPEKALSQMAAVYRMLGAA